jgi:APA family basic amino acid/polyamine antiporter
MHLKRTLGPIQLTFYSIGVIIGAGVYSVIGAASAIAQQSLWLSFVVGGFVALLTALSYAEMTTSFPTAGAEYSYVRRALPRAGWLAFMVAMIILIGASATAATVAVAFGGYLREFFEIPTLVSALLLLVGCTVLNVIGLKESSWANITFTLVEIGGLLLVIAAGLSKESVAASFQPLPHPGVIEAAAVLFFVYLGFEEIANLAEEVKKPARDIPIALFVSIAVTTGLYVMVALTVLALATPAELAGSDAPLALAVQKIWPNSGPIMSAIALFATANTVLITLIATSRLLFSMARDRVIHESFATLSSTRQTPAVAALLTLVVAAILVPLGNVKTLAEASSFSALLAFLVVNTALVILRYREPKHHRPFRVPLSLGNLPVLPLVAIACIIVLLGYFERGIYIAGTVVLFLSAVFYSLQTLWTWRKRRGQRGA